MGILRDTLATTMLRVSQRDTDVWKHFLFHSQQQSNFNRTVKFLPGRNT